ncbi:MAG: phytanoyl-CoA dioxygenase family protein [Nannocystaceae bacterium]
MKREAASEVQGNRAQSRPEAALLGVFDDPANTTVHGAELALHLGSAGWDADAIAQATRLFRRYGLCWLPEALSVDEVARCRDAAEDRLQRCLHRIEALGHPPLGRGTPNGYRELVARAPGRYDMLYGTDAPPFTDREVRDNPRWMPLIRSLLGADATLFFCGLLMTRGGASDQPWHTDGEHLFGPEVPILPAHCVNVFLPLVDITIDNGGTEFCPGSHFLTVGIPEIYEQSPAHVDRIGFRGRPLALTVPAGSAVIFDYRLLHRGLANRTDRSRPILYLTFAAPWFRDVHNFPARRLFPETPP